MKPPKRETTFEKVAIGEFINGTIEKIEYEMEHKFSFKGEEKIGPAIRLVFKLEGYEYPHRSRWMTFSIGEKSNLYKKYITKLVANATPDMDIDLDCLTGMKVRTIWEENNGFQALESIFPGDKKVNAGDYTTLPNEEDFVPEDDDVPM